MTIQIRPISRTISATIRAEIPAAISAAATAPEQGLEHHDFGADPHALVKIDDVRIAHSDATRGHVSTDCPRLVRAVDTVKRRTKVKRPRTQRIIRAAGNKMRKIRLA